MKGQVMPNFPNHIFYRQSVNYGYILDFYCPTLRLGLEIDGSIHDDQKRYDRQKDSNLARRGIQVLRYRNEDVFNNPQTLANQLCKIIQDKSAAKRSGCFIATAAYGTPMALEIQTLRRFRDEFMERSGIGRKAIGVYYDISPSIANKIFFSQTRRRTVRFILKPILSILRRFGY
jgi:hypothetical protein